MVLSVGFSNNPIRPEKATEMFTVQHVETLEHPELLPYRTMKQQLDHYQRRIFVAEGEKVVRRLLESRFTVVSLLLPEKWLRAYEPLLNQRREEIHAFVAERRNWKN